MTPPTDPLAELQRLQTDIVAAARYWRAVQTRKGAPYQAIEHAHRLLTRAVDAYEGAPSGQPAPHPADCECAPCWQRGNYAPGTGD